MDIDLLHPDQKEEKAKHKLKRMIQSPNSFFMDVKCPGAAQRCGRLALTQWNSRWPMPLSYGITCQWPSSLLRLCSDLQQKDSAPTLLRRAVRQMGRWRCSGVSSARLSCVLRCHGIQPPPGFAFCALRGSQRRIVASVAAAMRRRAYARRRRGSC
eukprot:TRINITY_DN18537_c0_g1_i2.p2 TRINITY_DN18537_c0_g1~~TRINITY_DN18537_c0_g1_i2.p2  ORF type:complete len:156 (-),score=23.64 TRINITY_DN18537_c0_g1_i2:466-933(-)